MDMPQIPTGMTHYASRVASNIGCAVYWNKECCRCIEFQTVRNAMTFTLSRDPLTLDGMGVALKQHDNHIRCRAKQKHGRQQLLTIFGTS